MIKYHSRKEINTDKYNNCIEKANNSRIYAYSWYLDAVADNWGALVLDEYKAVMPLPWRKKYFLRYVYLPVWTQQLGIFSIENDYSESIHHFLKAIPRKFKFIELNLNAKNRTDSASFSDRINYLLPLQTTYNVLAKNYKKGRKSDLKNAEKHELIAKEATNASRLIAMFRSEKGHEVNLKSSDYQKLKTLTDILQQVNRVLIIEITTKEHMLLGGAIFIIGGNRITYLFSTSNDEGREKNAITYLIDQIVVKYSNSNYTLDFEGSMKPNLAFFFKSFGATEERYFHYKRFRL